VAIQVAYGNNETHVPVIDLGGSPATLRDELALACQQWGIFTLVNHTIPEELMSRASKLGAGFFGQPLPVKQALSRSLDNPWGFYDRELTKNLRDRKEIFDFGPDFEVPWPRHPADFRATLEAYSSTCYELGLQLLDRLTEALGTGSRELRLAFEPEHSSFTRLNYYPVSDTLENTDAPPPGPLGISRHTDAGGLTILLQDEVAGLQVYRDGWLDIAPRRGALTINIGDMLQVWSNDRFRAPLHRVRASKSRDRYSIAYFLNPSRDCVVEPLSPSFATGERPHYSAVPWGEFRDLRAQGDYGDFGEEVQIAHYRIDV
jgi:isopenicillin N synthase-like dioxygenase